MGGVQSLVDARSVLVGRQLPPGEEGDGRGPGRSRHAERARGQAAAAGRGGRWAVSRAWLTRGACSWAGSCRRARGAVGGLQGVVDTGSVLVRRQLSPGEGGGGRFPGLSRRAERDGKQAAAAGRGGGWAGCRAQWKREACW